MDINVHDTIKIIVKPINKRERENRNPEAFFTRELVVRTKDKYNKTTIEEMTFFADSKEALEIVFREE